MEAELVVPSKSEKQARLMRAVAHGWKPSRIKGPSQEVAREFVEADRKRGGVTKHTQRKARGGVLRRVAW